MYFPYFRGRQYELLALRELVNGKLIRNHVIPVVEPVKESSTFANAMEVFAKAEQRIGLVFNPTVGELSGEPKLSVPLCELLNESLIPALIVNENMPEYLRELESNDVIRSNLLTIMGNRDYIGIYNSEFSSSAPRFTLFSDDRQIRRTIKQGKVLFEDKFKKQRKNADYPEEEFFSEDHLYYTEEGYQGFGDYSVIGDEYTESGFAPYAVAIHIVYFADDNTLRIRHFVSDSNADVSDVAGKFHEAVTKLDTWYRNLPSKRTTTGLDTLLRHYKNETYPGLPTLKKLSVMHHLELVERFLSGETQA